MLYKGFSTVGNTGIETRLLEQDLIKQDIINHFNVLPGEVPGRPTFGCVIKEKIGELNTEQNRELIDAEVRRVLDYDPRVRAYNYTVSYPTQGAISIAAQLVYTEIGVEDFLVLTLEQKFS